MSEIQTVSIAIASAGVFAAAIYYILQIRHQTRIRQTDLIMRLYSTFNSLEFSEAFTKVAFAKFKDARETEEKCSLPVLFMVGSYFEGVGVLLHKKLVDIGVIYDLLPVSPAWEGMKPWCLAIRQKHGKTFWEWFEYLYNEVRKREQKLQSKA